MDIPDIFAEFEINKGYFPREAVEEAIKKREAIIPELLKIMDHTIENASVINREKPTYMAHLYAMYLLAQFREKSAYRRIVDLFSLPGDVAMYLGEDFVTEDLCRVFASVSDGDDAPMKAIVENQNINEYIRNAALRGIVALVACGAIPRDSVVEYLRELYRGRLEKRPCIVWTGIVSCSADLYPEELMAEIREAFAEDLVRQFFINLQSVERGLRVGKQKVLDALPKKRPYTLIGDTVKEMEGWACFQPRRR